jgi:TolB-like protein
MVRYMRFLAAIPAMWLLVISGEAAQAAELKEAVEQLASQLAKGAPEGKPVRIAVTDLPDLQGVTSDLGRYVAERLTSRMIQSGRFRVIERRRLGQVLNELRFSMSDLVDPAKAKQLGRLAGVDALVVGSVSDLGNSVEVDARIIEVETSNMLLAATATISKDDTVKAMLDRGRVAPAEAQARTPLAASGGGSTAATESGTARRQTGVHVIEKDFHGTWGWKVHVFNAEIVEGQALRLNCAFVYDGNIGVVELRLDDPTNTTFLVDQVGRQYLLTQVSGISAEQPVRVAPNGSRRFSLLFPLGSDVQSFKYRSTLVVRGGTAQKQEWRLGIEARESLNIGDFR